MAFFQEIDSTFIYPEATALEAKGTDKVLKEKLLPLPNFKKKNFFCKIIVHVTPWINPLLPSPTQRVKSVEKKAHFL